jgi:hypothetical protein
VINRFHKKKKNTKQWMNKDKKKKINGDKCKDIYGSNDAKCQKISN